MLNRTQRKTSIPRRAFGVFFLCIAMLGLQSPTTTAQDSSQQQSKQPEGKAGTGPPPMPDVYALNLRIRNTIIALNQANITGNYTVFRELATPSFQGSNNPARLTDTFAALRKRDIDMSPVFFFNPKLIRKPEIRPDGLLRLTGYFPTKPEQINFDMMFQFVDGRWRLHGIAVDTIPATGTANAGQKSGNLGTGSAGTSAPAPQASGATPKQNEEARQN
jgi:hypothetical protein